MKRLSKRQLLTLASAILTLAGAMGSTLLTPAQREAVLAFLSTIIAVFGV